MVSETRRLAPAALAVLRSWQPLLLTAARATWQRAKDQDRMPVRNLALAGAAAAAATLVALVIGLESAGPVLLVDVVVVAAAWFGGLRAGLAAALTALVLERTASPALAGTVLPSWAALLAFFKWVAAAILAAAMAARLRGDGARIAALHERVQALQAQAHQTQQEFREMEATAATAHALLRDEADLAHQQLTSLLSVTDPALNVSGGPELVGSLLERLRMAVDADGVAIYHHHGLRGRVLSATNGVEVSGTFRRAHPAGVYQSGRTTIIHNDAARVAESSICRWPPDVASLILVPVMQAGRLQLVLEVASRRPRRSTEWELALSHVVAERVAGVLRADASFDTGAVA